MPVERFSYDPRHWDTFYPSFCDVKLNFTNLPAVCELTPPNKNINLLDLRRISYSDKQECKFLFGVSNTPLARTGRVTECSGELEIGLITYQAIVQTLNQLTDTANASNDPTQGLNDLGGYGDISFNFVVTYQLRPGTAVLVDELESCRFLGSAVQMQNGGKPISVSMPLQIASIARGVPAGGQGARITAPSTFNLPRPPS